MRRFTVEERRSRLARRHRLTGTDRAARVEETASSMVVLHATDPATIYLSALARMTEPSLEAVGDALYERRTLVRHLAMRRTLFVVPVPDLPLLEHSSSVEVAAQERARLETALADSGFADPAGWLEDAWADVTEALADGGLAARQLTARCPLLSTKVTMGGGKWAMETGVTSKALGLWAVEGRLLRGRPSGQWTGRMYTWHLRDRWLGASGGADGPAGADPDPAPLDPDTASTELVRRWLEAFGPATFDDLKWWTGWRVRQLRPALERLDVAEVDLDGQPGLALASDLGPDEDGEPEPWAALLPSLDPTPMGWKERDWYLGDHQGPLFDRNGNIGPTVWVDGAIVGGWSQAPDGQIVTEVLEDVGGDAERRIEAEVDRLQPLLGETVVKPSFPTPLQKELSAG